MHRLVAEWRVHKWKGGRKLKRDKERKETKEKAREALKEGRKDKFTGS